MFLHKEYYKLPYVFYLSLSIDKESVKYCSKCGYRLRGGTEKYCPECGIDLHQQQKVTAERLGGRDEDNRYSSIGIHETKGDVIGTDFNGIGNIVGKEIFSYKILGNVFVINTKEGMEALSNILATKTQIEDVTPAYKEGVYDNKKMLKRQRQRDKR